MTITHQDNLDVSIPYGAASSRVANRRNDFNMVSIDFVNLKKLVAEFQDKRLTADQQKMVKLEHAGNAVLYAQLAEAYRIGLILLTPANGTMFCHLMESNGMAAESKKYADNKYSNAWAYVTKLLYGSWVEQKISNTVFQVFEAERSTEKYANVLRHLALLNAEVENVPAVIAEFEHKNRNGVVVRKLLGLEVADREENSKGGGSSDDSTPIKLGTSVSEHDVFHVTVPNELDPAIEFGSCFFRVSDGQMIVFGATKLDESQFNALAARRGRDIKRRDDELEKAAKDVANTSEADRKAVTRMAATDPKLHELRERLLNDPDYAIYIVEAERNAKKNLRSVKDDRDRRQKAAFSELTTPDSGIGPVTKAKPFKALALVKHQTAASEGIAQ